MNYTHTVLLRIIGIVSFIVLTYCLAKLVPILRQVIQARKANAQEVVIQGETWKVSSVLLTITTIPYAVYAGLVILLTFLIFFVG